MSPILLSSNLALFAFIGLFLGSVSGHVFVYKWKTSSYSDWQRGQKEWKVENTAYRHASENIGFVGSNFLTTNKAIVCGASNTPKGRTSPSYGKFFSDASESAGKTLNVRAGGTVTLALQGDTDQGYPHHHGHMLAYLGRCGASPTACQSFDASTASYFKIQEERDGVNQLHKQHSHKIGADLWKVVIPKAIPQGSYIFRFEIITCGESVQSEGYQDQYYPSCGQLYVESNYKGPMTNVATIKFPSGYNNRKLNATSPLPGPPVSPTFGR